MGGRCPRYGLCGACGDSSVWGMEGGYLWEWMAVGAEVFEGACS